MYVAKQQYTVVAEGAHLVIHHKLLLNAEMQISMMLWHSSNYRSGYPVQQLTLLSHVCLQLFD